MRARAIAGTLLLIALAHCVNVTKAQTPQGFNYQAVVRNGSGNPVANQTVSIKLTLLNSTGTVYYSESKTESTNAQGVLNHIVGSGTLLNGSFTTIPWSSGDIYIKVEIDPAGGTSYTQMGDPTKIESVPYALYADKVSEVNSSPDAAIDDPIFVVKNKDGQIVFAVYQTGVRVYVEDTQIKGARGGFAVGGLTNQSKYQLEYFRITPDSARIWVNEAAKGARGGFAIGGLTNQGKGSTDQFLDLTKNNYLIGQQAGKNITTGLYNSFMGYQSGQANTTGSNNVFIGFQTGLSNQTGANNVAVGNLAGSLGTAGTCNVFIGDSSGHGNTNSYNVFLGKGSGKFNTGQYNAFLGYQAGLKNTGGTSNVFIGNQAGFYNTTGGYNTFLGFKAGYTLSTNSYNTYLGYQAGANSKDGDFNVVIGPYSGYNNNGDYNIFIGYESGYNNISGADSRYSKWNTFIGYQSGKGNTTGWHNLIIGYQAGLSNQTATNQFFIGNNSGENLTVGYGNTFVGHLTGQKSTDCSNNTFIGYQVGYNNLTGNNNTYIGYGAGLKSTGSNNILIGYLTGYNNTAGSGNVFIGNSAGYSETGSNLLYIDNSSSSTPLIYGDFSNDSLVVNGKLRVNGNMSLPIVTVSSNTTLGASHYTVLVNANVIITLPAANMSAGKVYIIKKITSTAGSVTIDGNGSETIDGATTQTISTQWQKIVVQSNGTSWFIIN